MSDQDPFNRVVAGVERVVGAVASAVEGVMRLADGDGPPHNIIRLEDGSKRIALCVPGFTLAEIEVEATDSDLRVRGCPRDGAAPVYEHAGFSKRPFDLRFAIDGRRRVARASLANGILEIDLQRVPGAEDRPRRVDIVGA